MDLVFFKELLDSQFVNALCWTLFHSLWQGLIFAFIAGFIMMATRNVKATFRYNILSGLFALFAVAVIITFIVEKEKAGSAQILQPPASIAYPIIKSNTDYAGTSVIVNTEQKASAIQIINHFISQYACLIVAIWFFILSAKSIKIIFTLIYTRRLKTCKSHVPLQHWRTKIAQLCHHLKITRPVALLESEIIKLPVVFGHFKPIIFIPLGLVSQLSPEQVEAIFVHELAHIRRNDYLVNLMQNIIEVLFFFNPAILWISSLIREERENCCDDIAIALTKDKKNYVEALISFKELSLYNNSKSAVAFPGRKNSFLHRVHRIVQNKNYTLSPIEKGSLFICCIIASLFVLAFAHPIESHQIIKFSSVHEQIKPRSDTNNAKLRITTDGLLANKEFGALSVKDDKKKNENNGGFRAEFLIRAKDTLPAPQVSLKNLTYDDALKTMRRIISDLVREKVVPDSTSVKSFALDENTLTVNDEQQPESMHEKLKTKYDIQKGFGLYYGPEKVQGRGIFIDENDRHEPVPFKGDEEMLRVDSIKQYKYTEMLKADSIRYKIDVESLDVKDSLLEQSMMDRRRLGPAPQAYIKLPTIISNLIDDLIANGIVKDKTDPLSFNLTNRKLIVNGEAQPENIHEILKQKYLAAKLYGLEHSTMTESPDFGLHFDSKTRRLGLGISRDGNNP